MIRIPEVNDNWLVGAMIGAVALLALCLPGCAWGPMTDQQRAMMPYVLSPMMNYHPVVDPVRFPVHCIGVGDRGVSCY